MHVFNKSTGMANWGDESVHATELYDHRGDHGDDFDAFENENLAVSPDSAAKMAMAELRPVLHKRFRVSHGPTPTPPSPRPPPPPTPARVLNCSGAQSSELTNVAFQGDIIAHQPDVASAKECCSLCARTKGCIQWAWYGANPGTGCHADGAKAVRVSYAGAVAGVMQPAPASGCTDDMHCSLNGQCVNNKCRCDAAWQGPACDRLVILPTDRTKPAAAYGGDAQLPNVSSWGGGVVRDDEGVWHLWVSEFAFGCGLSSWLNNSRIVHATSLSPTGPFQKQDTPLEIFAHNAAPLRAPPTFGNGSRPYFLFHIGILLFN